MTAIPATLMAADTSDAVEITLDGLKNHRLTEAETRNDILLFFDVELPTEQARKMSGYLKHVIATVRNGEMTAAEAAEDIRKVIRSIKPE